MKLSVDHLHLDNYLFYYKFQYACQICASLNVHNINLNIV